MLQSLQGFSRYQEISDQVSLEEFLENVRPERWLRKVFLYITLVDNQVISRTRHYTVSLNAFLDFHRAQLDNSVGDDVLVV